MFATTGSRNGMQRRSAVGGRQSLRWEPGAQKLTCSARPYHSVICYYRALIRLAARRERPNGFAIELEQRSPKPAFVLPEDFKSHVPLNLLAANNMVTLKPSCHFCLAESPRPPGSNPLRRSLLERFGE
jgi:hypothetical protein